MCLIREFLFSHSCVYCQRMCVFFKSQHIGRVMEDDSFPFLIAMVPVAWLPGGDRKGADTNIL